MIRTYSIGKLAKTLNLHTDTIRYYERLGLVEMPLRLSNGYRCYSKESEKRFLFIQHVKAMGFTLKEIKEMLDITHPSKERCDNIKVQAREKIDAINKKILELKKLKKILEEMVLNCEKSSNNTCPILSAIE
ncbi:MAG: MerR family transcriptional regulator [Alphaproteobacteria bacterium]|nr:MerR family transcriptional regulator [Alphaproteobacteria bacterium]